MPNYINPSNLPAPIMQAVINYETRETDSRTAFDTSATKLIKPARISLLEDRHDSEIEVDVADCLASLDGTAMHAILEKAEENVAGSKALLEHRMVIDIDGMTVGLKPDRLVPTVSKQETWRLEDWKRCGTREWGVIDSRGPKMEWTQQGNIYRLGAYMTLKIDIVEIRFCMFFKDWHQVETCKHGYPSKAIKEVQIPLWDLQSTRQYLGERVAVYRQAEKMSDADLPLCTPHEKWARPELFKVMKPGAKRAIASKTSFTDAEKFRLSKKKPNDYQIKRFPGEDVRCQNWCRAKPFCSQYLLENPAF